MDILEIGATTGKKTNFMDLVKPPYKKKCERYVQKCGGPYQVFVPEKTPMEYFLEAFEPLKKYKDKIDVIIDSSTTKGFLLPSQASLYAQQADIKAKHIFDMAQACNGFCLGLQQAYMMFETNEDLNDKYILIINNEQPPDTRALEPKDMNDYKQMSSYFVGLTFSSVCTCTILKRSQNYSWKFYEYSNPIYASHISIGLPDIAKGYVPNCDKYDVYLNNQYGQFCIPRLHQVDEKVIFIVNTYYGNKRHFEKAQIITHTFTNTVYEQLTRYENFGQVSLYYSNAGNLASCSLPYVIWNEHGGKFDYQKEFVFFGNAAGGADSNLVFINNYQSKNIEQDKEQVFQNQKPSRLKNKLNLVIFGIGIFVKKIFCPRRLFDVTTEKFDIKLNEHQQKAYDQTDYTEVTKQQFFKNKKNN